MNPLNDKSSKASFYFGGFSKTNLQNLTFGSLEGSFRVCDIPSTFPYRDGPTEFEIDAAAKHRAEINRQCRVLIFNCPWRVLKFLRQWRQLMAEIDQKLFEGFYLQAES